MKTVAVAAASLVSQVSQRGLGQKLPAVIFDERRLPAAFERKADAEIPNAVWSAWIPSEGQRELRRALTDDEFAVLNKRQAELIPALAPYLRPEQDDEIAEAVSNMFSGFPSMRQRGEDVAGRVMIVMDHLKEFPAWAIKKTCLDISQHGYVRGRDTPAERIEKSWPPTDSEIFESVEIVVAVRKAALASATALLAAPVEVPVVMEKVSRAEIEAKLGRAISNEKRPEFDNGHGARVAADLAARKAAREAQNG